MESGCNSMGLAQAKASGARLGYQIWFHGACQRASLPLTGTTYLWAYVRELSYRKWRDNVKKLQLKKHPSYEQTTQDSSELWHHRVERLRKPHATWFIGAHRPVYWSKKIILLKTNFQHFLMASTMEKVSEPIFAKFWNFGKYFFVNIILGQMS